MIKFRQVEDVVVEHDYGKLKKARREDVVVERDYGKLKKAHIEDLKPLKKGFFF